MSDLRQPDHPAASEHEGSHDDARAHPRGLLRQVRLRRRRTRRRRSSRWRRTGGLTRFEITLNILDFFFILNQGESTTGLGFIEEGGVKWFAFYCFSVQVMDKYQGQCFSTFFYLRSPFGKYKVLRNS